MNLSKQDISEFISELNRRIPNRWFKANFINLDRYIEDFNICRHKIVTDDISFAIQVYCEAAADPVHAIYENSNAIGLQNYNGPKLFIGLEKQSLELSYKNYIARKFYSEIIELTTLMAFLGHEYEAFKYHVTKNLPSSTIGVLFTGARERKNILQSIDQLQVLLNLYEAIMTPEPSITLLNSLVETARVEKCYINPNVITILERTTEQGIKRFRRY